MGILPKHLKLIGMEYNNNPDFIRGDVLTLGQQSVHATYEEVLNIFNNLSIHTLPKDFDITNKIPSWVGTPYENRTNAQTVLTLLGAKSVEVMDISPIENPDHIIDLNNKIDITYDKKFDVIFDIGTLEHIFDISTALENITRMIKPGGRIIFILPASNAIDHGFYQFSPTLLYDFFLSNGFYNFECYLMEGNPLNYLRKGNVWKYMGFGKEYPLVTSSAVEVFFTAIKSDIDYEFKKPIQKIYLDMWDNKIQDKHNIFLKRMQRIRDMVWKIIPEFIETKLTKFFIGHKNLIYIGRY